MARPPAQQSQPQVQDDPGESNDPSSSRGAWDMHSWTSLNQIFERLGKMDQKLDRLSLDQGELKSSVDKHDKIIMRVTFTIAGFVALAIALWFIYDHFLKDHLVFK